MRVEVFQNQDRELSVSIFPRCGAENSAKEPQTSSAAFLHFGVDFILTAVL